MPIRTKSLPSLTELTNLLHYDPDTGYFTWKVDHRGAAKAGSVAGCLDGYGYRCIKIRGVSYKAHRIAWLMGTGEDAGGLQINHINSDRSDNRLKNLELVTTRQNMQHSSEFGAINNDLPMGVCWHKAVGRYHAQIHVRGKLYGLGFYDSPGTGGVAYQAALEAVETIMVGRDQVHLLLANSVEQATGYRIKYKALRELPLGVSRDKGRFKTSICVQGKSMYLGTFDTPEEASKVYQEAKKALMRNK